MPVKKRKVEDSDSGTVPFVRRTGTIVPADHAASSSIRQNVEMNRAAVTPPFTRRIGMHVPEEGGMQIFSQGIQRAYVSPVTRTAEDPLALPTEQKSSVVTGSTDEKKAQSKAKVSNTIAPHLIFKEFSEKWAPKLLETLYECEYDDLFGKACKHCTAPESESSERSGASANKKSVALYRCYDCIQSPPMCDICIMKTHKWNPFHRIDMWTGTHLIKRSLYDLGFVHYIGHYGEKCPKARQPVKSTIVHTNGVQNCLISYCGCGLVEGDNTCAIRPVQLLTSGLYPASFKRVKTAMSVHVLKLFHHLTMQGKLTAHDFYFVIRRLTNNAFFQDCQDRYRQFMIVHRQYTFLRTLRWCNQNANERLLPGSLTVLCPACPQPGINMDPNWKNCKEEDMYIHVLSYAKDGNFQQNLVDKKMDKLDFPLTKGASYYANEDGYPGYLKKISGSDVNEETTTCSNFKAMTNRYKGKLVSGIVSLTCSRQGYVLPSGTVDLTKGETYGSVDYATVNGLQPYKDMPFVISSYDINCQYGKNFKARVQTWTDPSSLPLMRRCVPKYHMNAHKQNCRWLHSFWLMPGTGQTDGEAVERRWASYNTVSRSTREMGIGHRGDVQHSQTSDFNMQKTFKTAKALEKKYNDALVNCDKHIIQLCKLETVVTKRNLPLHQWRSEEREFKLKITSKEASEDPRSLRTLRNPYEPIEDAAPSEKQVIAYLNKQLNTRKKYAEKGVYGLGNLIRQGIELQDQQESLKKLALSNSDSAIDDKRAVLEVHMKRWSEYHRELCSAIIARVNSDVEEAISESVFPDFGTVAVEEAPIPLPSSYPPAFLQHPNFKDLLDAEKALRESLANDILEQLRSNLALQSYLRSQAKDLTAEVSRTRNGATIGKAITTVDELRAEYTKHYNVLLRLGLSRDKSNLQELTRQHCNPLVIYHPNEKLNTKAKDLPWIWQSMTERANADEEIDKWTNEMLRVEWFRFSAKTTRWIEEKKILEEEIRRTQRFFLHSFKKWKGISDSHLSEPEAINYGRAAFAARQSAIYSRLFSDAREIAPETLRIAIEPNAERSLTAIIRINDDKIDEDTDEDDSEM